ncbi:hypothetical protein, conserved [Eimeria praecox]|uniref:Transporter, major facilitator family domain containing protein n=1 Tax=Eimeria praecox TaxID=51316 RepID=U6H7Q1_9EIME|nr:hypothetical protein, conserved [Eimeria praecox]
MKAAGPKDDGKNSKTSSGRRASVGSSEGKTVPAQEECSPASSVAPCPASSPSPSMAGPATRPSTEECFPLVARGTFPDLETGGGVPDALAAPAPATPVGISWGGWRRSSNNGSDSSSNRQQQESTPVSLSPIRPELPNEMVGPPAAPQGLRSPADEKLRRWWKLFGLEPQALEQQRQEQEQRQQEQEQGQEQPEQQQQHPRVDVRFTSVVFLIFFALEIFVNFDCGAIPCTLSRMADEFRLSPTWQGMLGALPYVGLTLASPFAGRIFAYWPAKRVLVISMALNALATLLMVLTVLLPHEVLPFASGSSTVSTGDEDASGGVDGAAVTGLAAVVASTPAAESVPDAGSAAAAAAAAVATSPRPFFRLPDFSFGDLTPCALLLLSSRLLVGLTQAPFVIFAPVWVDEFAPPKKAALWMGVMQGAAVVGVTVGYLAAGALSVYLGFNWRAAISFQVFFLCVLTGLVASIPREYIQTPGGPGAPKSLQDAKPALEHPNDQEQQQGEEQQQQQQQKGGEQDPTPRQLPAAEGDCIATGGSTGLSPQQPKTGGTHRRKSTDVGRRPPGSSNSPGAWPSSPAAALGSRRHASLKLLLCVRDGIAGVLYSMLHRLCARILSVGWKETGQTPMYMLPVLTLCALLFVVTGVQFWGTIFFASFLGLSPAAAVGAFAAVAATSPVAGVLMGGLTVDAVGGYKTLKGRTRTLVACTVYAAIAVACGGSSLNACTANVRAVQLLSCSGKKTAVEG